MAAVPSGPSSASFPSRVWFHQKISSIQRPGLQAFLHKIYLFFCSHFFSPPATTITPLSRERVTLAPDTATATAVAAQGRRTLSPEAPHPEEPDLLRQGLAELEKRRKAYEASLQGIVTLSRQRGGTLGATETADHLIGLSEETLFGCQCPSCSSAFNEAKTNAQAAKEHVDAYKTHIHNYEQLLTRQATDLTALQTFTQHIQETEAKLAAINQERNALTARKQVISAQLQGTPLCPLLEEHETLCTHSLSLPRTDDDSKRASMIHQSGVHLLDNPDLAASDTQLLLAAEYLALAEQERDWSIWEAKNRDALQAYDKQKQTYGEQIQAYLTACSKPLPPTDPRLLSRFDSAQPTSWETCLKELHKVERNYYFHTPESLLTYSTHPQPPMPPLSGQDALRPILSEADPGATERRLEAILNYLAQRWFYIALMKSPEGQQLLSIASLPPRSEEDHKLVEATLNFLNEAYASEQELLKKAVAQSPIPTSTPAMIPSIHLELKDLYTALILIWRQHLSLPIEDELARCDDLTKCEANARLYFAQWLHSKTNPERNAPLIVAIPPITFTNLAPYKKTENQTVVKADLPPTQLHVPLLNQPRAAGSALEKWRNLRLALHPLPPPPLPVQPKTHWTGAPLGADTSLEPLPSTVRSNLLPRNQPPTPVVKASSKTSESSTSASSPSSPQALRPLEVLASAPHLALSESTAPDQRIAEVFDQLEVWRQNLRSYKEGEVPESTFFYLFSLLKQMADLVTADPEAARTFFDTRGDHPPLRNTLSILNETIHDHHLLSRGNAWRKEALRGYLQLLRLFPVPAQEVSNTWWVSSEDKLHLLQCAFLANYDALPTLKNYSQFDNTPPQMEVPRPGFDLDRELREAVTHEGFPDETLMELYENSTPNQPSIDNASTAREYIEYLRALSAPHVAEELFPFVEAASPLDHSEGQERQARALHSLLTANPASSLIQKRLEALPATSYAIDKTLKIPARLFYLDVLLDHFPVGDTVWHKHHAEVVAFNQALMDSTHAPSMLIGYARALSLAAQQFLAHPTEAGFCKLLRYKIAYQSLKQTYFSTKVPAGFLKMAMDRAEAAMAQSALASVRYATSHDLSSLPQQMLQYEASDDPNLRQKVSQAFSVAGVPTVNGLVLSLGTMSVDLLLGTVYCNGKKLSELPAALFNHPHVRLLHLQELSYEPSKTEADTYEHSRWDETEQKEIAVVRIRLTPGSAPFIEKRIQIGSGPPYLHYLPFTEALSTLPKAWFGLGAEEFWADETHIYGFTKEGSLIATWSPQNNKLEAQGILWRVPTTANAPQLPTHLEHLLPLDACLMHPHNGSLFIPSLGLILQPKASQVWVCEGAGVSGLEVERIQMSPSPPFFHRCLVLKSPQAGSADTSSLQTELTKAQQRLDELQRKSPFQQKLEEKTEFATLTQQIARLREAIHVQNHQRIYLSPLMTPKVYQHKTSELKRSFAILLQADPAKYLEAEAAYRQEEAHFLSHLPFSTLHASYASRAPGSASAKDPRLVKGLDLASCAELITRNIGISSSDPYPWIADLARYAPTTGALDSRTRYFVKEAARALQAHNTPLTLYLHLLLLQDSFHRLQTARSEGKPIASLEATYTEHRTRCETLLHAPEWFPAPESILLINKYLPKTETQVLQQIVDSDLSPVVTRDLCHMAAQSWLTRLNLTDRIKATPKQIKDMPPKQQAAMTAMERFGPAQMAGVRYEDFGIFSTKQFLALFPDKAVAQLLLDTLVREGIFVPEAGSSTLFSLADNPQRAIGYLARTQRASLLALLSRLSLPLSIHDKETLATKLEQFLFQTVQKRFAFSWQAGDSDSKHVTEVLKKERKRHESEALQAEYWLSGWLRNYNAPKEGTLPKDKLSLSDLKRILLTGRHHEALPFAPVRNALIRYLFHTTERQHIDNILSASETGARNQMELLSTARQYGMTLACARPAPTNSRARNEQLIQLTFLLFEEDYGHRCDAKQFALFRALLLEADHPEAVDAIQAPMGMGKTTLAPLLALVQIAREMEKPEAQRALIRYIVPAPLVQENTTQFNARLSRILGLNFIRDREFPRYCLDPKALISSLQASLIDLEERLACYDNARRRGIVLVQDPEIARRMAAQEDILGELLATAKLSPVEQRLCAQCKRQLGTLRSLTTFDVCDELDLVQASNSGDVNFTEKDKKLIDPETLPSLALLIDAIQTYIIQHPDATPPELAHIMLDALRVDQQYHHFVTTATESILTLAGTPVTAFEKKQLLLIRALVLDPEIRSFVDTKRVGTHFGGRYRIQDGVKVYVDDTASRSKSLLAIPYDGTHTPNEGSFFENREVAACATLRYYDHPTTSLEKVHVDFLVAQEPKLIPEVLKETFRKANPQQADDFFSELARLSRLTEPTESTRAREDFQKRFFSAPTPAIRRYMGMAITARQVGVDALKANSNRYEKGSPLSTRHGFSGTTDQISFEFKHTLPDPATDGKIALNALCHPENQVATMASGGSILASLLAHATEQTRALIDVAGMCQSPDGNPETVVKELWALLNKAPHSLPISGIIYYDKNDDKKVFNGAYSLPCNDEMEAAAATTGAYFAFFSDKKARGSDFRLPSTTHTIITCDRNLSNNRAKQGALRLRDIINQGSKQTCTFVTDHALQQHLKHKYGRDPLPQDLACLLMDKEQETTEREALFLFQRELHAILKQAAAHLEHQLFNALPPDAKNVESQSKFLQERRRIVPLLFSPPHELEEQYGQGKTSSPRDTFIETCRKEHQIRLNLLYQLHDQTKAELSSASSSPLVEKSFFEELREQSVALFCDRFSDTKKVEAILPSTPAEGADSAPLHLPTPSQNTAVAVSHAQSHAAAATQSLATPIAVATVEVEAPLYRFPPTQERFSTPKDLSDSWFRRPENTHIGLRRIPERILSGHTIEGAKMMYDRSSTSTLLSELYTYYNPKNPYQRFDMPPYSGYHSLCYFTNPVARKRIGISAHLGRSNLLPRFALKPNDPKSQLPYLFISQEEADRWKVLQPQENKTSADYSLVFLDPNNLDEKNAILYQMQQAILQRPPQLMQQIPPKAIPQLTTQNLQQLSEAWHQQTHQPPPSDPLGFDAVPPLNVDPSDFLPSWAFESQSPRPGTQDDYINFNKLSTYGVTATRQWSLEIGPAGWGATGQASTTLSIAIGNYAVRLPRGNAILNDWLRALTPTKTFYQFMKNLPPDYRRLQTARHAVAQDEARTNAKKTFQTSLQSVQDLTRHLPKEISTEWKTMYQMATQLQTAITQSQPQNVTRCAIELQRQIAACISPEVLAYNLLPPGSSRPDKPPPPFISGQTPFAAACQQLETSLYHWDQWAHLTDLQLTLQQWQPALTQLIASADLTPQQVTEAKELLQGKSPEEIEALNAIEAMQAAHDRWFGTPTSAPATGVVLEPGRFWDSMNWQTVIASELAPNARRPNVSLVLPATTSAPSQLRVAVEEYRTGKLAVLTDKEKERLDYYEQLHSQAARLAGQTERRIPPAPYHTAR